MTLLEATEWFRVEAQKITTWIDRRSPLGQKIPLSDQIRQAFQFRQMLVEAAGTAMYGKGMKSVLVEAFDIRNWASLKRQFEVPGTGQIRQEALLKKLLKIDTKPRHYEPACFVGGTLVHTKDGIKPIEQIKVGDLVLSKHENGEGERAYKRVTKTFVHENRQVMRLVVGGYQADGTHRYHGFAITAEHPFWVQGKGWKEAGTLKGSVLKPTMMEILADENPNVVSIKVMYVTANPDVAWVPAFTGREGLLMNGLHVDVATMTHSDHERFFNTLNLNSSRPVVKPEHLYRTTVYNIEVEDFHTYYVGEVGVWVHNTKSITNKPDVGGEPLSAALAARPFLASTPPGSPLARCNPAPRATCARI